MSYEQRDIPEYVGTAEEEKTAPVEQTAPRKTEEARSEQWLGSAEIDQLQSRWSSIQQEFVDEPRTSVEQAKALVAETADKVTRMVTERQSSLDASLDGHEESSTEDLRIALQQYRTFFNRLLTL